jgi:hypothetical protein
MGVAGSACEGTPAEPRSKASKVSPAKRVTKRFRPRASHGGKANEDLLFVAE